MMLTWSLSARCLLHCLLHGGVAGLLKL